MCQCALRDHEKRTVGRDAPDVGGRRGRAGALAEHLCPQSVVSDPKDGAHQPIAVAEDDRPLQVQPVGGGVLLEPGPGTELSALGKVRVKHHRGISPCEQFVSEATVLIGSHRTPAIREVLEARCDEYPGVRGLTHVWAAHSEAPRGTFSRLVVADETVRGQRSQLRGSCGQRCRRWWNGGSRGGDGSSCGRGAGGGGLNSRGGGPTGRE